MVPGYLLIQGDSRAIPLADRSCHMVVCSPPYFGLRDYLTGRWEGGDDPGCDHKRESFAPQKHFMENGHFGQHNTNWDHRNEPSYRSLCRKCGARRIDRQIGLEANPAAFVETMVRVGREIWRVLRDDGTFWMNLGDSYAAGGQGGNPADSQWASYNGREASMKAGPRKAPAGLKPKDLVGVPWRVALALQADGWYLRSDIIWSKPNPMPESVTDRPTKSHEYLFLLTKSGTSQFWTHRDHPGTRTQPEPDYRWVHEDTGEERADEPPGWREKGSPWDRVNLWKGRDYYFDAEAVREPHKEPWRGHGEPDSSNDWRNWEARKADSQRQEKQQRSAQNGEAVRQYNPAGRNLRSVWQIPTESFPGAHFATYPRKLVEPCIKAGTSERGCCPRCSSPWVREVERENHFQGGPLNGKSKDPQQGGSGRQARATQTTSTLAWHPSCQCPPHEPVPAIVFDPFAGSGTTLIVANALGRHGIGLDLSREYLTNQAQRRITRPHGPVQRPARAEPDMPLFASSSHGGEE